MMVLALREQMSHMCACQVIRQKYVHMQTSVSVMVAKIYYKSMFILFTIFKTSFDTRSADNILKYIISTQKIKVPLAHRYSF